MNKKQTPEIPEYKILGQYKCSNHANILNIHWTKERSTLKFISIN